ncbi:hypothetical protein A3860_22960 [Niastella vici]|uniref:Secretion system C-terminal sorting domain-containing protein n=1 Tax=Niastella vici TaxID=1703345 RepID=A0A1V9FZP0_9BACT|nr:T9SS type A sorting domain-containing protein [Niastella vici]OQP63802.1 hypothetical protein A3860_22960 [Niastella vici]
MKRNYIYKPADNYAKALERLQNNLRTGRFASFTQQKKQEIWRRLCRYARQLGIEIKASLAAACVAAGLCLTTPAQAQTITFAQQTGASNPFNGVNLIYYSNPTFEDIDNDGDKDAFIGRGYGEIFYYKNTGTATAPVFTSTTGAANPFNGVDVGDGSAPTFVDIDNDGDKDAFIGAGSGQILYYKNTGTATAPVFTSTTGAGNPFNGVTISIYTTINFVDIDNDGDKDAFIGANDGTIYYYKNTGTASAPVFTSTTGASNPFNGVDVGFASDPNFVDIDGDGDMDAFIGAYDGTLRYYKNTGTASAPVFTLTTGASNPLNGVDIGANSTPAFVDVDNDGDKDVFIGNLNGAISYYKNTSAPLPLTLLNFNGSKQTGYNTLAWNTASEENTKAFNVQLSMDNGEWKTIGTVAARGSGSGSYSFNHNNPATDKNFYRLKMVDVDGTFTYSNIILLNNTAAGDVRVSIYPNPGADMINISVGNNLLNTKVNVYSVEGKLLQSQLITSSSIQLSMLNCPKGIYLLKFENGMVERVMKN